MIRDINELRKLLASGAITESDLSNMTIAGSSSPQNELAQMLQQEQMPQPNSDFRAPTFPRPQEPYPDQVSRSMPQPPAQEMQNFMRTETGPDAGSVVNLDFRGQQQQRPQSMKVAGYGGGIMSDLGSVDQAPPALDYSRPIEVPGRGKGYYAKDGSGAAYVQSPDGSLTKVMLGYDRDASYEQAKRNYLLRQADATLAHTQEETAASQQARNTKEGLPGMGIPQSLLDKQFGKAPDGKRWTNNGTLEDLPGSDPKLTEFQGKSESFGTRAAEAHEILKAVGQGGKVQPGYFKRSVEAVPVIGGALGTLANATQSADQQQVEQAQRNFVNATLRQESGATINPSEFDSAAKQYFPQPGDSPAVIAQKERNRELVISSFGNSAGPAKRKVIDASARARAIFDAKSAIARGAPAAQVKARLQSMGINDGI